MSGAFPDRIWAWRDKGNNNSGAWDPLWERDQMEGDVEYRRVGAPDPAVAKLVEALEWYESAVDGCRKVTREGIEARFALDRDGGERARAAIANYKESTQ